MERQIAELIGGCLRDDRAVTVVARSCDVPAHPRLNVHLVSGPAAPLTLAHPWFELAGSRALRRYGQGIVHTAGAIVPDKVDVTTVHFCHRAYNALGLRSRASRNCAAYRANARLAAVVAERSEQWSSRPSRVRAVVAISNGVRREVEEHYPALRPRLSVIPHGVDLTRFRPDGEKRAKVRSRLGIPRDACVAAFIGGDWPRKGLEHAIAAVAHAPTWRLLVVGAGDRGRYETLAHGLGAAGRVTFAGISPDPSRELAACDAFMLPSAYETFSLVTYEAAATGLPLLVTRVSGPDELVVEDRNGWFLGADPKATARRLQRLGDEPELRMRMGAAARKAVLPYNWEAAVRAHLQLYDSLAEPAGRHH